MIDLSIVLRFFALSNPEQMESSFKDHLSEFMEERNKLYEADETLESQDTERFTRSVINSLKIFGVNAFRNSKKQTKGPPSLPVAEAIMIALADYDPKLITEEIAEKIQKSFDELCELPVFEKAISSGTNGKGAIKTRINMTKEKFGANFSH
jgi:hypothetical protein